MCNGLQKFTMDFQKSIFELCEPSLYKKLDFQLEVNYLLFLFIDGKAWDLSSDIV